MLFFILAENNAARAVKTMYAGEGQTLKGDFDTLVFHLKLLSRTIDAEQYPLTKMIIEHHLSAEEYAELFRLLDDLNETYQVQKEEGLLDFSSLYRRLTRHLEDRLDAAQTIYALKKEGYYPSLMTEFIKIMNNSQ